ncbi:regulator of G-protein signaling 9-binding protein-like [Argiope bruennichi]|uniref:regulator of G-protein signaling 9-binding protein-like n=1 Tax=Argiope bruennichi TaxID=94029 RepID=UPI0024943905|nr:regulator of G-protein signaling 9-binding protein-like [Argiope bruennichi]XP_055948943.1 regulator of G-protein signaling 9-binding protein-like [Argiope bruennichi]
MENGRPAASCSPAARNYQLPSFSSCLPPVLSLKADSISTQCSEIIDHFSMEIAQAMAPKSVVKEVEDLSHQICKYHSLALTIGTNVDGANLRQELLERQQKACNTVVSTTSQLSEALRRQENIPKKEMDDLNRSCRVLVACVHTLDRELRRTLNLYHLFPLAHDPEGTRQTHFIQTGYAEKVEGTKDRSASFHFNSNPTEKYFKERTSWQELENEILRVHDLDVVLHRDEILGPILDLLTLCPAGEIPGSKVSLDEGSDLPDGYCDEETLFRKSSNLFCYIAAIVAVACIGGGVLMGVIFMMVQ